MAEEGSVGLAATRLRLAQPALSRQLQSLERAVGASLLRREPRGTRVTPEGAAFHADVITVFAELESALLRVQLAAQGMLGRMRIGLSRSAIDNATIGRALGGLAGHFPNLDLTISDLTDGEQRDALRLDEVDIAIGLHGAPREGVSSTPLLEFALDGALLAASHPLAGAAAVEPAALRRDMLLLVATPAGTADAALERLRCLGIARWEAHGSVAAVYSLVAAGRGWSVAPLSNDIRLPLGTVVRPLAGFSVGQTLFAYTRAGNDSPAVANVLTFLRQALTDPRLAIEWPSPDRAGLATTLANIELKQLRALVALKGAGSVSLAAERLGITQSGMSRRIKALERAVGSPVLRRTPGGAALTAPAEALAEGAERITTIVDSAIVRARRTVHGIVGRCVVASVSTEFSGEMLVQVIQAVAERHPGITIEVAEMMTPLQVSAIQSRRASIGIAGASNGLLNDRWIVGVPLEEDSIECALVAEDHPLAMRSSVKPSDLTDVPFILFERAAFPQFYDTIMDNFAAIGLTPLIPGAFNSARALWRAATDLGGWTLGARSMLARPLAGMVAVPIEGLRIPTGMQLIWRRDERDPVVTAVLEAFDTIRRNIKVSS